MRRAGLTREGLRLHPLNYLLIAAGFFAFHVLLAYLVDHVTIHLAFWIAAAVSVFLVVSYLRLVLGAKAAIRYAGAAQMVYLVFFSYAFFWRGWTGLTIVIGAILTLLGLDLVGIHGGPYIGILAFVVVPTAFVGGLALIPIGIWLERRRMRQPQMMTKTPPLLYLSAADVRRTLPITGV